MRLLPKSFWRAIGAAVLLTGLPGAASAEAIGGQGSTAQTGTQSNDRIIVTGRRNAGRYRLPPQFRTVPESASDGWREALKRGWSCHDVGPVGCGLQPNPLVTFRTDGTVQFGDPGGK